MPKASPLQALRRKSAAQQRLTKGALPNSAYDNLKSANDELQNGRRRPIEDGEGCGEDLVRQPATTKRRTKRVAYRKTVQMIAKPAVNPVEEVIQNWRPAAGEVAFTGDAGNDSNELSAVLGVARIPTWRSDVFQQALRTAIAPHGEIEELFTNEFEHGGENHTDVYVRLRSELVAESVKEKIDGSLVEGRKLQIKYA